VPVTDVGEFGTMFDVEEVTCEEKRPEEELNALIFTS
jgi:hypothetical protein